MALGKRTIEQRRFIRHPLCFPLVYKIIERGTLGDTRRRRLATVNVSRGGLLFSAEHPIEVDSLLLLEMPFQDKVFSVEGKVVHCTRSLKKEFYNIGVCFQKFDQAFKVRLIEQMYLIREYQQLQSRKLGREVPLQQASQEWIERYSKAFKELYW